MRTVIAALLATLLFAAPAAAQERSERAEVAEALTLGGLGVFVGTYALTGLSATTLVIVANARDETIAESWIPLVGPWLMLADSAGFNSLQVALTAVSGVLQTLSLGAMIAGLVLGAQPDEEETVRLLPAVGPSHAGLHLSVRF